MLFIGHVCCRGLRRPRGLKFYNNECLVVEMSRGLRRPRGLKSLEDQELAVMIGRGLRRPRGLKYNFEQRDTDYEKVEVCEDLVD